MRGLPNKWRNLRRLMAKRRQMRQRPDEVRFDRMEPILRENFQPDDDAIVRTNMLEMSFFLKRAGCQIEAAHCTDRYVFKPLHLLLNLLPTKYAMFNSFIVARKR